MEQIESLNRQLMDQFGIDTSTGQVMFRIVWANDQTEMRLMDQTETGVDLLVPEVRRIKKYWYLKDLYVLERLTIVPDINQRELPENKLSYEPLWAYHDANGHPVPPIWEATKFIIDTLYAALGKKSMRKYIESEKDTTKEGKEQRISELQLELFGNETDTCDALRYNEGIVVPTNYKEEN